MKIKLSFLLLLILGGGSLFPSHHKQIVVTYHEDFPPYCYEENGQPVGIFPEMVTKAAEKIGITVRYRKYPWRRAYSMAKTGNKDIDAVMPLFKTDERSEFLYYPENGIALLEAYFFADKNFEPDNPASLEALKPFSIGIVENYYYGETFNSVNFPNIEECASDKFLLLKFSRGRFEVGAGPCEVVEFYAKQLGIKNQIKPLGPPFLRKILHIGFLKKEGYRELANEFSKAIRELGNNGFHEKVLKKYNHGEDMVYFKPIIIGTDVEDYPPYSYWEDGQLKGICPDIIQKSAEHIGVNRKNIQYNKINWKEFPDMIRRGEIGAIMPLFKNKEREDFLYYPDTGLAAEKNYFFALNKNKIMYSGNLKDLRRFTIGVVENYYYGEQFQKDILNTKKFTNVETLVKDVELDRIKIGIGEYRVIKYFAEKLGIADKIEFLNPPFPREFLYIAFSRSGGRGHKYLAWSFSEAIKQLRKKGEIHTILENYGIKKRTVLLAANNWQSYYGENLDKHGPLSEIITEAFKKSGYDVKIDFLPWPFLLEKVKKGKYDGGFCAYYTDCRAKEYIFSNPIVISAPCVFYKRNDVDVVYKTLEDLKYYRIGISKDFVYPLDFDKVPGIRLIEANNPDTNISNLLRNRLDLVIVDQLHAKYLLAKRSPADKKKLKPIPLFPDRDDAGQKLYLLISKESMEAEQLIIDFNHGLKLITEDGTVEKILKSHGVGNDIKFSGKISEKSQ